MKSRLIIFLSIIQSVFAFGQYELHQGDTLFVIAKSGLQLREKPNLASNRISVINYGESVIVKTEKVIQDTIEHRIGYWVEIYNNNQSGFVFDGFLSEMKAPTEEELKTGDLVGYMLRITKSNENNSCKINFEIPSNSEKRGGPIEVQQLSEFIVYRHVTDYECRTHQFIFSNFRQSELFSLIDLFYSNWEKNSSNLENELRKIEIKNQWSVVVPGYGLGFDYHVKSNEALISFWECN